MPFSWLLRRSPLAPGVPLEGSETVAGLRTLERMRMAELLQAPAGGGASGGGGGGGGWRRSFQRYRGPFIEQLSTEDAKQAPKSWALFWKGTESGSQPWHAAYSLPASLGVLHERTEENFVTFLPNYLRLAAAVLLATFYLRPKALLGAAAVGLSMYRSLRRALERQAAEVAAATEGRGGGGGGGRQQGSSSGGGGRAAAADPNEHIITAGLTVLTWFLVAWSRCMPVLLLGSVNALLAVLLHCGLRRAPSEYRYRGRAPLGFTWSQLVGREPVPEGAHTTAVLREMAAAGAAAAARRWHMGKRYLRYYLYTLLDVLRHPGQLLGGGGGGGRAAWR